MACQEPYLTAAQVLARFLWAIAHIFWHEEWLKVLWSDEVTFLIGGRTAKEKVTRKRGGLALRVFSINFTAAIRRLYTRGEQLDMVTRVLCYLFTGLASREPLFRRITWRKFLNFIFVLFWKLLRL